LGNIVADVITFVWGSAGVDRSVQGLLGAGRRLAESLGGKLRVAVLGGTDDSVVSAIQNLADIVVVVEDELLAEYHPENYLVALVAVCQRLSPRAVLLGNDTWSQELAPRLAHRLGGSSAGDAVDVAVVDGQMQVKRGVYGGKATAVIALARSPGVVWVRALAMPPAEARGPGEVQRIKSAIAPDERVRVISRNIEAKEGVRLEDARLIVSGGRGLGGPEPFKQLQDLADAIGAQMAASRAACDAGWVPPSWQVGQTGKKVAPELYLAVAISGASQHIMGIADSKVICAINRDPDAPIFKHCRFGLVEDYKKVVGPLIEKLKRP
jgi:electron transfer flavoprotein alpha subunit